ncbi:hypothetical protein ZEAMMB73_Zm00001d002309 [Zea mays]|nr:hypothetical protein ZEAMMB73_Zm00001d002309 [Zea mays]
MRPGSTSRPSPRRCLYVYGSASALPKLLLLLLAASSSAQAQQAARMKTDPVEAAAVNAVFAKLRQTASSEWNISGDPCTGIATDGTVIEDNGNFNPGIKCECSDQNNITVCHVTKLKIYALNAVGPIPQELQNLTRLINLDLSKNYLTGSLPSFLGNLTAMQYMTLGTNALSGSVPKELGNLVNLVSL